MPRSHIFAHCIDCGSEYMTRRKPTARTGGVRRIRCYSCERKRWHNAANAANMFAAFGMRGFSYASAKR